MENQASYALNMGVLSLANARIPLNVTSNSNINGILIGENSNKIVDLSDVVGTAPAGAAPTKSPFST